LYELTIKLAINELEITEDYTIKLAVRKPCPQAAVPRIGAVLLLLYFKSSTP
jgi:hypothetical protein